MTNIKPIITNLTNNNDIGNGISNKVSKDELMIMTNKVLDIINSSLQTRTFLDKPVSKVSATNLYNELILILPKEKILELIIKKQLSIRF